MDYPTFDPYGAYAMDEIDLIGEECDRCGDEAVTYMYDLPYCHNCAMDNKESDDADEAWDAYQESRFDN